MWEGECQLNNRVWEDKEKGASSQLFPISSESDDLIIFRASRCCPSQSLQNCLYSVYLIFNRCCKKYSKDVFCLLKDLDFICLTSFPRVAKPSAPKNQDWKKILAINGKKLLFTKKNLVMRKSVTNLSFVEINSIIYCPSYIIGLSHSLISSFMWGQHISFLGDLSSFLMHLVYQLSGIFLVSWIHYESKRLWWMKNCIIQMFSINHLFIIQQPSIKNFYHHWFVWVILITRETNVPRKGVLIIQISIDLIFLILQSLRHYDIPRLKRSEMNMLQVTIIVWTTLDARLVIM